MHQQCLLRTARPSAIRARPVHRPCKSREDVETLRRANTSSTKHSTHQLTTHLRLLHSLRRKLPLFHSQVHCHTSTQDHIKNTHQHRITLNTNINTHTSTTHTHQHTSICSTASGASCPCFTARNTAIAGSSTNRVKGCTATHWEARDRPPVRVCV